MIGKTLRSLMFLLVTPGLALAVAPYQGNPTDQVGAAIMPANQSLAFNSQTLGMKGPLSLGTEYSQSYGLIFKGQYTQLLGKSNAMSLLLDGGSGERRINATWSHLFSAHQRIKFSAERLWQRMSFDFDSGKDQEWIGQNAFGSSYQYLFPKGWLSDLHVAAFYSKADSKNLSSGYFYQGSAYYENFRHIAGGTDKSLSAGFDVMPFSSTQLGATLNYDNVHYDMKYEKSKADQKGFGLTLSLNQLLTHKVKLNLLASQRATMSQYGAGVGFMLPSHAGSQLELDVNAKHTAGHHGLPNDTTYGVDVDYHWGDSNANPGFSLSRAGSADDLALWTATPAVKMDQVLAIRDQRNVLLSSVDAKQKALADQRHYTLTEQRGQPIHIRLADYTRLSGNAIVSYDVKGLPTGWTYDQKTNEISAHQPALKTASEDKASQTLEQTLKQTHITVMASEQEGANKTGYDSFSLSFAVNVEGTPVPNANFNPTISNPANEPMPDTQYYVAVANLGSTDRLFYAQFQKVRSDIVSSLEVTGLPDGVHYQTNLKGSGDPNFSDQTLTFTGTPTTEGTYPIEIRAKNFTGEWSAVKTITYIVGHGGAVPVWQSDPADATVTAGDGYTLSDMGQYFTVDQGDQFDLGDDPNNDSTHICVMKPGAQSCVSLNASGLGLTISESGGQYALGSTVASDATVGAYQIKFNGHDVVGWSDKAATLNLTVQATPPPAHEGLSCPAFADAHAGNYTVNADAQGGQAGTTVTYAQTGQAGNTTTFSSMSIVNGNSVQCRYTGGGFLTIQASNLGTVTAKTGDFAAGTCLGSNASDCAVHFTNVP
jgi:hypothetical protein